MSIRIPEEVRNRMKAVAAARGEKLQDLVGGLIGRFLEEAERKPPELGDVLRRVRILEAPLRARGVASLWVFGSVARGEAQPDSDVNLTIDFASEAQPSLLELGHIKDEIQAILGRPVDLAERYTLSPEAMRSAAQDMVRVF